MTKYLHTNNASSTLRTGINAAVLTIQVQVGHGVLFPNPSTGEGFFVTVEDRRIGRLEIMLCTSRVTDTLTVVRGQQGTIPQSFGSAGVNVSNRITAQILNEFVDQTTGVFSPSRIPPITSAMLDPAGLAAADIKTGVFATARIPTITNAMISALDAAKITTGILPDARLPSPISSSHLPPIPSSLLTSVPAANLTGTVPTTSLPNIPSAKLTSVPADNLTGTVPNASISGNYDGFNAIATIVLTTDEVRADIGSGIDPSYTFTAAQNAGMGYNASLGPFIAFGGAAYFSVNSSNISALNGAVFTGSGSGLINLQANKLEGNVPVANLKAAFNANASGSAPLLAVRAWGRLTLPSTRIDGDNFSTVAALGGSQYRVTFSNAMATANYGISLLHSSPGDGIILVSTATTNFVFQTAASPGNTVLFMVAGQ